MSLPNATNGFQEIDVLPVLSNDPGCNFLQFLDFAPPPHAPTESVSFSATADLQTPINSVPFRPTVDTVHSLSGFDVLASSDDDNRATQLSPWSAQSGPTRLSEGTEARMTSLGGDAYGGAQI